MKFVAGGVRRPRKSVCAALLVVALLVGLFVQLRGPADTSTSTTNNRRLLGGHGGQKRHVRGSVVTIFTILKETDPNSPVVWNTLVNDFPQSMLAVSSWLVLERADVILFGTQDTCVLFQRVLAAMAGNIKGKVKCLPIPCTHEGIPTYDCLFYKAAERADSPMLLYVNADIVLFPDMVEAADEVYNTFPNAMAVGLRRDLNLTSTQLADLKASSQANFKFFASKFRTQALHALNEAASHDLSGMDYMLFHRAQTPQMPPFLVGRIEWDNWVVLKSILSPEVTSIDVTQVVTSIHINHGGAKASHSRTLTQYNQQLAQQLPHPRITVTTMHYPGTIWLGRIDNAEVRLMRPKLAAGAPSLSKYQWTRGMQSFELLLYQQHGMVQDRRSVVLVAVTRENLERVGTFYCAAKAAGIEYLLWITSDQSVYRTLIVEGYTAYLWDQGTTAKAGSVAVLRMEATKLALMRGYNVLFGDVDTLLVQDVNNLLSQNSSLDVQTPIDALGRISLTLLYVRSRGRTHRFWEQFVATLSGSESHRSVEQTFRELVAQSDASSGPKFGAFRQGALVVTTNHKKHTKQALGVVLNLYRPKLCSLAQRVQRDNLDQDEAWEQALPGLDESFSPPHCPQTPPSIHTVLGVSPGAAAVVVAPSLTDSTHEKKW